MEASFGSGLVVMFRSYVHMKASTTEHRRATYFFLRHAELDFGTVAKLNIHSRPVQAVFTRDSKITENNLFTPLLTIYTDFE